jgi:hypothetical protein
MIALVGVQLMYSTQTMTPPSKIQHHILGIKHTMVYFHDFFILMLNQSIFIRSARNSLLPINSMRVDNLLKSITNIFTSTIGGKIFDILFALSFNKSFE